mgnify:CR=1 FL=1|tara:strand:+ start:12485 stop:14650 length:2166 start_codon:yes stop_codon:yes gene_type:complete
MVLIEVTKVCWKSPKNDWAMVECRKKDGTRLTCGGMFGCANYKIVPGQVYRGPLVYKRDRNGKDRINFKGIPVSRIAHSLKWGLKSAGLSYQDSAAVFTHMKPLSNLLNALKNKKYAALMDVPGIGRKKLNMIYTGYERIKVSVNMLEDMGKTFPKLCEIMSGEQKAALLKWFGNDPEKMMAYIQADPWRILYDCEYDSFHFTLEDPRPIFLRETTSTSRQKMATAAIEDLKLLHSDPRAKRVKCIHTIKTHMMRSGDYWMPLRKFMSTMGEVQSGWPCIVRDNHIALKKFAEIEEFLTNQLEMRLRDDFEVCPDDYTEVPATAQLDDRQRLAVRQAIQNRLFILQGGAGVGKTSVCKWIVHALKKQVVCAAPTGKAAQRLAEVTGVPANTVHRLAYKAKSADKDNAMFRGTLLLDEQSMQEPEILAKLLSETNYSRIIFVGDTAQLTSVGPGQFLKDICASDIPRIELTKIYRAGPTSFIASNGQKIRNGDPNLDTSPDSFEVFPYTSDKEIINTAKSIYVASGTMPMVLCNTNEEVSVLNPELRKICNPIGGQPHSEPVNMDYTNGKWRYEKWQFGVGDSVINIKNKYEEILDSDGNVIASELQVANGEIGTVLRAGGYIVAVAFPQCGSMNTYKFNVELEDYLRPAYALTVNKSQGSEYPTAIVKSKMSWGDKRERFYTAVTRAKTKCIVYEVDSANRACITARPATRKTYLMKHTTL